MPADVEHEAVVFDRAADAAHVHRVLLDHDDRGVFFGEAVGGGEAGRSCADHEDVGMGAHRETWAKANRGGRWEEMGAPAAAPAISAACGSAPSIVSTSAAKTA